MTMKEEVIEGQEIVVTAERPIVEKDRTTTTAYISSEQLEALPLVSINEAINQQAGVVDGHFRGGRIGEVAYLVNGVPINQNSFNNTSFDVEQNMVSSLEVISGVFNADMAKPLAGCGKYCEKGVPSEFSGNFLGYTGRIVVVVNWNLLLETQIKQTISGQVIFLVRNLLIQKSFALHD